MSGACLQTALTDANVLVGIYDAVVIEAGPLRRNGVVVGCGVCVCVC